jgi:hypothetical protein
MKQSGPRGVLCWVACLALLINALLPAAICVGLFDASRAEADPLRFLLISGKPIGEPVAWYGPIVMNPSRGFGE